MENKRTKPTLIIIIGILAIITIEFVSLQLFGYLWLLDGDPSFELKPRHHLFAWVLIFVMLLTPFIGTFVIMKIVNRSKRKHDHTDL